MSTGSVDGQVVVVTGGTRGIGLGLAREFLARGCRVVVCGRTDASAEQGLAALAAGERATGLATDVTDRASVQALWDHAVATFGRVDVWVNNAGISAPKRAVVDIDQEVLEDVLNVNLVGTHNACAVAAKGMAVQPGGGFVWNMEGFGSDGRVQDGIGVYGTSKYGLRYLTKALVKEHKESNVKFGFLSPGIVVTDLLVGDYADDPEGFEKAKKIFNILADRVETVTPYLAENVLAATKNGARVEWLTNAKVMKRFLTAGFSKRDLFAEVG